ncbi:Arc family DNA-binding protein [Herbaspirillum huttiense]|uniref:Arc family DNA-binding protein n=1 Tax=Herbaspirillum huttiense TaxID=863372 RepID=UPI0031E17243
MKTEMQKRSEAKDKFIVRFEDEAQRISLKVRAAENRRTMNAEILFLIEKGIEAVDGLGNAVQ